MPLTAVQVPAPDRVVVGFVGEADLSTAPSFSAELAQGGRYVRIVGAPAATRRLIAMADFTAALDLDGPVQFSRRQPGPLRAHRIRERSMEIPA